MGCIQGGSENYYEYSKNDEEKYFREWEKAMGCFRNNFNSLYELLITDERAISNNSNLKALLVRNYNEKFLNIVNLPYFSDKSGDGKQVYNANKLRNLLFLTTIHIQKSNKGKVFCDKADFLFNQINKDDEKEACEPIEKSNPNLHKIIEEFYEISAIVMAELYQKQQSGRDEIYKKLANKENKRCIIERILTNLFTKSGKEINTLSFDEFNSLFVNDKNVR